MILFKNTKKKDHYMQMTNSPIAVRLGNKNLESTESKKSRVCKKNQIIQNILNIINLSLPRLLIFII